MRWLLALLALLALPTSAAARSVGAQLVISPREGVVAYHQTPPHFVDWNDDVNVTNRYAQWASQAALPTPQVTITALPPGTPVCATDADGCRGQFPSGTSPLSDQWFLYANDRSALYFELGGISATYLTGGERAYLARRWGVPHWHWVDTQRGLNVGVEDGLEVVFASIYQDCALSHNTENVEYAYTMVTGLGLRTPDVVTPAHFDNCAWLATKLSRSARA